MKIGDRVVNKLNGKHGTITSVVRPVQIGRTPLILLRMDRDEGGYDLEREHNYCLEESYVKGKNNTWETEEGLASPKEVISKDNGIGGLTPAQTEVEVEVAGEKPKAKKSKKNVKNSDTSKDDAISSILNSVE